MLAAAVAIFALPASAADIVGATYARLSFAPSSGPVAGYHLFFQYDGEAAPGQLVSSLSAGQREVLVSASAGQQVIVRLRPFAANGAVGPFSQPSEPLYFVPEQDPNSQSHEAHDSIATVFVPTLRSGSVTFDAYRSDRSLAGSFNVQRPSLTNAQSLLDARVARCDFDGDGIYEFAFGFGDGSRGRVEIRAGHASNFALIHSMVVGDVAFHSASGGTYPACGDTDGDGTDELLVGRGAGGGGIVDIFRDENYGFASFGKIVLDFAEYTAANGETHPALGDVDGDGRDEVAIGLGVGGGNYVAIRDDMYKGFGTMWSPTGTRGWLEIAAPHTDGSAFPVMAQLDQDAQEELVVGLGVGSNSRMYVFDDAVRELLLDFPFLPFKFAAGPGWLSAIWSPYTLNNGTSMPAALDSDSDGVDELIIGHGVGGDDRFNVLAQGPFGPVTNGSFFLTDPGWASADGPPVLAR